MQSTNFLNKDSYKILVDARDKEARVRVGKWAAGIRVGVCREKRGWHIRCPRSSVTLSLPPPSGINELHAFTPLTLSSIHSPLITMLSRAARPAITLARTANQQQAGMATLKEIEQRCVDSFGRRDRGDARSGDGAFAGWD